jgi:hypothetical protein
MPAFTDQLPDLQHDLAIFVGGLDEQTPTLALKPGYAIARTAFNYEAVATPGGGYRRITGYERYDGHAKPSMAGYYIVQITTFTNVPSLGQTLTGQTSAATGTIIALVNSTTKYLVLTQVTGAFTLSEAVNVGATPIGTAITPTYTLTPLLHAQYKNAAADVYRALISAISGAGPIRGVFALKVDGVLKRYAIRDAGAVYGVDFPTIWEATPSGWDTIELHYEIGFTDGSHATLEPAEGDTLTDGTDTAIIRRVVHESGSWAAGTAAGRFIIDFPDIGTLGAGGAAVAAVIVVTLTGPPTSVELGTIGGRFEVVVRNFGGQLTSTRAYFCDGVNRAYEYDGHVLVPLTSGADVDTPKHVQVHLRHLFLAVGSSLMISGPGTPYKFNAIDGGAEIACGDEITGLVSLPTSNGNATLLVQRRNSMGILFGSSAAGADAWRLFDFNNEVGGVHYSQAVIADAYFLDDSGVQSLRAAAELSGFAPATLTQNLQRWIDDRRGRLSCVCTHHGKSQYRLFFSDGSGLWVTIANGKMVGAMPMQFHVPINVVWNCEDEGGRELTLAGGTNGMVYELDRGTSFDGEVLDSHLRLAWDAKKSPRILKSYRRASLEMSAPGYVALQFSHRVGYGQGKYAQPGQQAVSPDLPAVPNWDAITWDNFFWDGGDTSPTEIILTGDGENIEITINSTTDYLEAFTLYSLIAHFFPRRAIR